MATPILHIKDLIKSFDGLMLFNAVNLSLTEGTINTLFGGNGTGKTTLFNMIGGYERPDSGKIQFDGNSMESQKEFEIVQSGIGKMWQDPKIFPNHTVLDNLVVGDKSHPGESILNYLFNLSKIQKREQKLKEKGREILNRFNLGKKQNHLAGSLSFGERKLVSICMLLMNDARLILLDEPFSSVSSSTVEKMSEAIVSLKHEGRTVFMIEHKIKFAESIGDHVFKIDNYKIEQRK